MALTDEEIADLKKMSTSELLSLRNSIEDEDTLRDQWSELSVLADPSNDGQILDIFKQLDLLPELERILNNRRSAVERAA